MVATFPILALSIIAVVSWVIVRTGATALRLTGVSPDAATFQAISGFFGVGFTTREAEMIVNHPLRRRIMTHLIIAGNLGITSGLATIIVAFVDAGQSDERDILVTFGVLVAVVLFVILVSRMKIFNAPIDATIRYTLERSHMIRVVDYESVLRTHHGFVVEEIEMIQGHELVGKTLRMAALRERGVLVLGITRDNEDYVGTPTPETMVMPGDVLSVYGRHETIADVLC